MHVYFVECMFVCVYSLTCCLRGPRGRLAMPNELPSINKDFHFTSLHFTSLHFTSLHLRNRILDKYRFDGIGNGAKFKRRHQVSE